MSDRPNACPVVLIMEDEPIQRMMLVDELEGAGCEVVEAMSADDAVRILEQRTDIRIVLADIDMPGGVDGLKLAASIRSRWPPIELIITSGKRRLKPEDMPARGVFFSKPIALNKLIEAMRRFAN